MPKGVYKRGLAVDSKRQTLVRALRHYHAWLRQDESRNGDEIDRVEELGYEYGRNGKSCLMED